MTDRRLLFVAVGLGLALTSLAGCRPADADTATPSGQTTVAVVASIASATLAEDCGEPTPQPAASSSSTQINRSSKPSNGASAPAAMPPRSMAEGRRACRQTSVQLALASGADGQPSSFNIIKAQLFDAATGALVDDMTTRNPQIWSAEGRYQPWDRSVRPSQKLQVSYDMNAPNWTRMGGSQMAAQGKSFRLELTVRVGTKESKIGTTVKSAELMIMPHAVT